MLISKKSLLHNQIIYKPRVVVWFKVYSAILCLIYFFTFILSPFFLLSNDEELIIYGMVFLILSIPLFLVCILPIFLPRRPWVWIYSLVIIGFGMTGCCLPACIPLLIFWIKPEVKKYYGYSENNLGS